MAGSNPVVESANQHRKFLEEHIDPDSGLLDKLFANKTLDEREIAQIKKYLTFYEKNSVLLDYILEKNKIDYLLTVLVDTNQKHIVNYLNSDGVYRQELGDDWPLTEKEIEILRVNHESLVDLIDTNAGLLEWLYAWEVINARQKEFISSESTSYKRNDALLNIVRRLSQRDYQRTIICLGSANQEHIAEIFRDGGVVVQVHANLNGTEENVNEEENAIATEFAELFRYRTVEEFRRIVGLTEFKLVTVRRGKSIVLYVYCKTFEELEQLQESVTSGCLLESIEMLFTRLLNRSQRIILSTVKISKEEYSDLRQFFEVFLVFRSMVSNFTSSLEVGSYEAVRGVTKLRNKIYVLCQTSFVLSGFSCVIRVFEDRNPFRLQNKFEIKEIQNPLDFVSCETENCIYVTEFSYSCVWKITIETKDEDDHPKVVEWLTTDYEPGTLSVSSDGELLVLEWSTLNVYGRDADLQLSLKSHNNTHKFRHAAKTSKGTFIILQEIWKKEERKESGSSGEQMEARIEWAVSEVSGDGTTIIRRFLPQNEEQKLYYPRYLSLDSEDRVFVADGKRGRGRVILLDSDLNWDRILLPTEYEGKQGEWIHDSWRLRYDEEKNRLIVGGGRKVNVYTLNLK